MGNQMESSIFVLDPIKGVFWPFKVERRIYLTDTVHTFIKGWWVSNTDVIILSFLKKSQ